MQEPAAHGHEELIDGTHALSRMLGYDVPTGPPYDPKWVRDVEDVMRPHLARRGYPRASANPRAPYRVPAHLAWECAALLGRTQQLHDYLAARGWRYGPGPPQPLRRGMTDAAA